MPKQPIDPFALASLFAIGYGTLNAASKRVRSHVPAQAKLKAISAGHATLITILALYSLRSSGLPRALSRHDASPAYLPDGNLDDRENPLIQDKSALANAITGLETGYLIYDAAAMVLDPASELRSRQPIHLVTQALKDSPGLFAHHVLFAAGFLTLQAYIREGRERGVWVIIVLILMNASTPLMHARWWARKRGTSSRVLDLALVAIFALCRFGAVERTLRWYGRYHGIGPIDAFRKLRWYCQAGTGGLIAMNGLWWLLMLRGVIRRTVKNKTKG